MSPRFYREDETISGRTIAGVLLGAVAGFAVGVLVAQKVGGVGGLRKRLRDELRRRRDRAEEEAPDEDDLEEYAADALEDDELLEERVLEAFRHDPVLAERAVDIGAIGDSGIELAGWVNTEQESRHAVTIARGVPGVDTVVNRLAVGSEEERLADATRHFEDGDPAFTEAQWGANIVGTGRTRQGTSHDADRHADPHQALEEHWTSRREAERNAADDLLGGPRDDAPAGRARSSSQRPASLADQTEQETGE